MSNPLLQCLLGVQCKDFVMLSADQMSTLMGVLVMRDDVDKLYEITERLVLGVNGDDGEMAQFTQFISRNLQLYKLKNKYQLSTQAVVHFIKKNMSDGLRGGNPYIMNLMIAGLDEEAGAQLYTMDFLATCVRVPYATHGLGGLFAYGIMDRYYRPDLTEPEAYEVLKLCVREVQKRLIINLPNFKVKIITKNGVKTLPDINPAGLVQK